MVQKDVPASPATRKADQVYTQIRSEIEDGSLKPGQRMSEVWLVEHTGASRTPVRDALRRLAADELIILEPRQAPMVSPLSLRDIKDLFEFRRIVEVAALEEIAIQAGKSSRIFGYFSTLAEDFRDIENALEDTEFLAKFRALTSKFDELVATYTHNQFLKRSLLGLKPHTTRLRIIAHSDHVRLHQSVQEHIDMCEAITSGDLRSAGTACRQHLIHVEKSILNALVNADSASTQNIDFRP
ncbi:transcriptional regulator [Corynebacterium suranareeae]|uniref:Transcriptional regulator n=1 Tax=Corynebacterium suranareeae TaxID=2506452 RepID=A0A169RRH6_9CORY|nr:GntR family transcriptional regulator [Corynebacterium suranareeae]BAU95058.1 transcriptional regulator [Corynebacterium suranareeae]